MMLYRKCCIVKVIVTNCCVDLHVIASYPIPCSPFHLILTPSELKLLLKPYYGPLVLLCCWSGGSSEGCLRERGREPSLHCCPFLTPVSRIPEKHYLNCGEKQNKLFSLFGQTSAEPLFPWSLASFSVRFRKTCGNDKVCLGGKYRLALGLVHWEDC